MTGASETTPRGLRRWTIDVVQARMDRMGSSGASPELAVTPCVRVFGGTCVSDDSGPLSVGGHRQQRLLALLVIRHGRTVTLDWLAEYLWHDDERPLASTTRLRTYIARLRQALPAAAADWVGTEAGGYRLGAPPEAIEHVRFEQLREAARTSRDQGDPAGARQHLDDALALWRGDPFPELEDLEWARADVERLRLDRLEMFEERWEAELALGRHTQITGALDQFVREQPLRERATRQLALSLHRSGRTHEALRTLADFRRGLVERSGLDPSPAMVELERAMLDRDPRLEFAAHERALRGYRLLEEVGAGAFAVVWRAEQPSVDRLVAVKQIRAELASRPEFIRCFEAESQLVARIEHPHVVPLIDYWRDPDSAYLVMRWLGGGTLERRLDDGPLDLDSTITMATSIGGALAAAHDHGIVHRDVKPSNILFDDNGHAYLTDFGIARGPSDADGAMAALSPGSPAYAAPEQLRGDDVGPSADVFALGVVIYECLSGAPPFSADDSVASLVDRQLNEPFPDLGEGVDGLPPAVARVIARATAKPPAERYDSVVDFIEALRDAAHPTPAAATRSTGRSGPVSNPFVGLRAFDESDATRFFGRERLVGEIVTRLCGHGIGSRCVVLVGPSGSGKSSVVRAGVVPALRSGMVPGSERWFSTTMVPGAEPFASMAAALSRVSRGPGTHPSTAVLRETTRGVLREIRRCVASDDERVVVVIDQFEELFVESPPDTTARFLDSLAVALDDPASPLRVIVTLRADYYDRPLQHPTFAAMVKETAVEITPLAPDELVDTITAPAAQVGVDFEPGLVARIGAEFIGVSSALPLLQYTLSELFERRGSATVLTSDLYDSVGGLTGAISLRTEALHQQASRAEQAAIRRVFGRLTWAATNSVDHRRRASLSDLGDDASTRWVLERFGRARLLSFDRDPATREPTVEVAHEALLREWPRAAAWLEEDRQLRNAVAKIGSAADEWAAGGHADSDLYRGARLAEAVEMAEEHPGWLRPADRRFIESSASRERRKHAAERRRISRLRRLLVGTSVALIVALVAGSVALHQRRRAESEAASAQEATARAELAALTARASSLAPTDAETALLLALEARRRSPGVDTDRVLLETIAAARLGRQVARFDRTPANPCRDATTRWLDADGLREFGIEGTELLVTDLTTGVTVSAGTAPTRCIRWFHDPTTDRRWVGSLTVSDEQWTAADGAPLTPVDVATRDRLLGSAPVGSGSRMPGTLLHPGAVAGRLLYLHEVRRGQTWTADVAVVDGATLEPASSPIFDFSVGFDDFSTQQRTASSDETGSFAVAGVSTESGDPTVVVVDAVTGEEQHRIGTTEPARALAFAPDGASLLIGHGDVVDIVELSSGQVVGQLTMRRSDRVIAVGSSPLGALIGVGPTSIELFDPDGEPAGLPVEIAPITLARVRPDGTVAAVPEDDRASLVVVDPTSGQLAERGWPVDPEGVVLFGADQAGVVDEAGNTEILDLGSGAGHAVDLVLPDGQALTTAALQPEAEGFLAWDGHGTITRWHDAGVTERLDLWNQPGVVSMRPESDADHPGNGLLGEGAGVVFQNDHVRAAVGFDTSIGALEARAHIAAPPQSTVAAANAPDGGLHLILDDGAIRTVDGEGRQIDELETGLANPRFVVRDPLTGSLAIGGSGGARLVDADGGVQMIDDVSGVVGLGFARRGSLLVVVESDGTVRLWDTQRGESRGTLWTGTGIASPTPPWYDDTNDSIWVATSGTVLELPLDPARWVDRACSLAGRELTAEEWTRLVPGDTPQRPACS